MKSLKKILPILILINFLVVSFLPLVANAQEVPQKCKLRYDLTGINAACTKDAEVKLEEQGTCCLINTILSVRDWLFYILLIIAAIFIIIAAYYFVTAAGDPEKVKNAKNFVLYALIGVLVALMARGLVSLVKTIAGLL